MRDLAGVNKEEEQQRTSRNNAADKVYLKFAELISYYGNRASVRDTLNFRNFLDKNLGKIDANNPYLQVKGVSKDGSEVPYVDLIKMYAVVAEYVESLGDKVKKRDEIKKEKEVSQEKAKVEKFNSMPKASLEAHNKLKNNVISLLEHIKSDFIEKTIKDITNNSSYRLNSILKMQKEIQDAVVPQQTNAFYKSNKQVIERMIPLLDEFRSLFKVEIVKFPVMNKEYSMVTGFVDNKDEVIKSMAESNWKYISEFFLHRVMGKLAPIVEAKAKADGSTFDMNLNSVRYGYNHLEVVLSVKFSDGSSFIVDHKVVSHINFNNTRYLRFPTTFHDVVLADGTRVSQPSVEAVYRKFAGIEPPQDSEQ